jgi:hypothetical protein
MKISEVFPSKFLKSDDLPDDEDALVTIVDAQLEPVGPDKEDKLCLRFREFEKALVCNKTNADVIGELYGDDTDEWLGKKIWLYVTEVSFQGKTTMAIRVRMRKPQPKPKPAAPPVVEKEPEPDLSYEPSQEEPAY